LWPCAASIRGVGNGEISLDELTVPEPIFDFSQWSEGQTWCICAAVPGAAFLPVGTSLEGRTWLASFSRYDYSSGEEPPVLSSTSPHAELSFHRQQEWTEVFFAESQIEIIRTQQPLLATAKPDHSHHSSPVPPLRSFVFTLAATGTTGRKS
jgi:hypothetical protein